MWPLIWYIDRNGLKTAAAGISEPHRDFAKKEQVTAPFLKSLLAQAKLRHSTLTDRPFGITELAFLDAGSRRQVFLLNGTDLKAMCGKLKTWMPDSSYVWDYFVRIGASPVQ